MIRAAIAVGLMLFFTSLFLKTCHHELQDFISFFARLARAAFKELRLQGGRTGTANLCLSVLASIILIFIVMHGVLDEVIEFVEGGHPNVTAYIVGCFIAILIFFVASVSLVAANDLFADRMRD
jgi:hypothetical protein